MNLWLIIANNWNIVWLVVLEHVFSIHIGNVIIPTDELIFFQRGRAQPLTRYSFQKLGAPTNPQHWSYLDRTLHFAGIDRIDTLDSYPNDGGALQKILLLKLKKI